MKGLSYPRLSARILLSITGVVAVSLIAQPADSIGWRTDGTGSYPKAQPPVVKIGEFGHYLYQLQKKEKRQRSGSKQIEVKTLRFGFRTDKHDLDRLAQRAREFFAERHLVKFTVRLRGRELSNKEYAMEKLKGMILSLADVAELEQEIKRQGTQFIIVLRPKH